MLLVTMIFLTVYRSSECYLNVICENLDLTTQAYRFIRFELDCQVTSSKGTAIEWRTPSVEQSATYCTRDVSVVYFEYANANDGSGEKRSNRCSAPETLYLALTSDALVVGNNMKRFKYKLARVDSNEVVDDGEKQMYAVKGQYDSIERIAINVRKCPEISFSANQRSNDLVRLPGVIRNNENLPPNNQQGLGSGGLRLADIRIPGRNFRVI